MSLGLKKINYSNGNLYGPATVTDGSNYSISSTSKFGDGSLFANDPTEISTSNLTMQINVNYDWDFSADQTWTIEAWLRRTAGNGGVGTSGHWDILVIDSTYRWVYNDFDPNTNNGLYASGTGMSSPGPDANRQISTANFTHFACVCNGSNAADNHKTYLDGVLINTGTYSTIGSNRSIQIGVVNNASAGGEVLQIKWDEFRVSNNQRYTADFTPSASAFSTDANTLLLMHFDQTNSYSDSA